MRDLSAWCAAVLAMHNEQRHRLLIAALLSGEVDPMDAYDQVDSAVGGALGELPGRLGLSDRRAARRNPGRRASAPAVEVMPPGPRKTRVIGDAAARYADAPLYEGTAIMEEVYNVADERGLSPGSMDHRQWQQVAREAWRRVQASRLPEERPRLPRRR